MFMFTEKEYILLSLSGNYVRQGIFTRIIIQISVYVSNQEIHMILVK